MLASQSQPSAHNVSRNLKTSLTASLAAASDDCDVQDEEEEAKKILREDASMFNAGLEAVVSPYVRIFSSFINAGRKFLLAHNRFVSIFNLTKERWTKTHHKFEGAVRQIFRNRKIPRDGAEAATTGTEGEQFDVGVLVGDSTFHFFAFEGLGKVSLARDQRL